MYMYNISGTSSAHSVTFVMRVTLKDFSCACKKWIRLRMFYKREKGGGISITYEK